MFYLECESMAHYAGLILNTPQTHTQTHVLAQTHIITLSQSLTHSIALSLTLLSSLSSLSLLSLFSLSLFSLSLSHTFGRKVRRRKASRTNAHLEVFFGRHHAVVRGVEHSHRSREGGHGLAEGGGGGTGEQSDTQTN